jgi:hypothetical protein
MRAHWQLNNTLAPKTKPEINLYFFLLQMKSVNITEITPGSDTSLFQLPPPPPLPNFTAPLD